MQARCLIYLTHILIILPYFKLVAINVTNPRKLRLRQTLRKKFDFIIEKIEKIYSKNIFNILNNTGCKARVCMDSARTKLPSNGKKDENNNLFMRSFGITYFCIRSMESVEQLLCKLTLYSKIFTDKCPEPESREFK